MELHRGFVFARLAPDGPSLASHLGRAADLLDRLCDLSPEGEIQISAGWLAHRIRCNWKLLQENNVDGYHVRYVHRSLFRATEFSRSEAYDGVNDATVVRDLGGGHSELDVRPRHRLKGRPFRWFGGVKADRLGSYVADLEAAAGAERAGQMFVDGPPHAVLFPNLFLAEMNLAFVEPIGPGETIQRYTPVLLKGALEFNDRVLRQFEAAVGPASFLLPEDANIGERTQLAMTGGGASWIGRGVDREVIDEGVPTGRVDDETPQRAFWRHYHAVMGDAVMGDAVMGDAVMGNP